MTTPGAPGTTPLPGVLRLIALGAPASLIGSELPPPHGTGLRPFALPRPDALSPPLRGCVRVHQHIMLGDVSILSLAVLALSGWGYAELRLYGVLRSSRKESSENRRITLLDSSAIHRRKVNSS
jgi:hypothetical protein